MEQALARTPRIAERVFTNGEREYARSKARPAVQFATFFAAREAVLKALGTGFAGVGYQDVEITHDENGKPEVLLHGNAAALAEQQGIVDIQISLSHTHHMAVASAVAIKAQSSPRKHEVFDPMEELARQFKELRSLLDDLGMSAIIDGEAEQGAEPETEPVAEPEGAPSPSSQGVAPQSIPAEQEAEQEDAHE
jgi:holo-[acyl-carrier protein] synthase